MTSRTGLLWSSSYTIREPTDSNNSCQIQTNENYKIITFKLYQCNNTNHINYNHYDNNDNNFQDRHRFRASSRPVHSQMNSIWSRFWWLCLQRLKKEAKPWHNRQNLARLRLGMLQPRCRADESWRGPSCDNFKTFPWGTGHCRSVEFHCTRCAPAPKNYEAQNDPFAAARSPKELEPIKITTIIVRKDNNSKAQNDTH